MATINSVLGPLDTADIGYTLSHEHVLVTSAGIQYVYPEFIDREGTIARAVADLKTAYSEGLRTIVDVTTIDLGRDIRLLEQVSTRPSRTRHSSLDLPSLRSRCRRGTARW